MRLKVGTGEAIIRDLWGYHSGMIESDQIIVAEKDL